MSIKATLSRHKNTIFICIIVLLAARVFIPQMDAFVDSLQTLLQANFAWILLGIVLYFTGIPVLALQMTVLSFKKLVFALTLRVQAATMFVNKILPQGVGTISLNIYYFIKKGHTPNEAGTALTMNAITSTVAYIILIIYAFMYSDISLDGIFSGRVSQDERSGLAIIVIIAVIGLVIALLHTKKLGSKIAVAWKSFKKNIVSYKTRPKSVLIATVLNGFGTSLNILTLIVCAKAIGIDISFADALLAYTFGNFAATFVPTPGGIGSAEMGIYSGLVITGLDPASAMSITLLYRFISYWLTILPGYYFFHGLRKTIFSGYSVKGESPI